MEPAALDMLLSLLQNVPSQAIAEAAAAQQAAAQQQLSLAQATSWPLQQDAVRSLPPGRAADRPAELPGSLDLSGLSSDSFSLLNRLSTQGSDGASLMQSVSSGQMLSPPPPPPSQPQRRPSLLSPHQQDVVLGLPAGVNTWTPPDSRQPGVGYAQQRSHHAPPGVSQRMDGAAGVALQRRAAAAAVAAALAATTAPISTAPLEPSMPAPPSVPIPLSDIEKRVVRRLAERGLASLMSAVDEGLKPLSPGRHTMMRAAVLHALSQLSARQVQLMGGRKRERGQAQANLDSSSMPMPPPPPPPASHLGRQISFEEPTGLQASGHLLPDAAPSGQLLATQPSPDGVPSGQQLATQPSPETAAPRAEQLNRHASPEAELQAADPNMQASPQPAALGLQQPDKQPSQQQLAPGSGAHQRPSAAPTTQQQDATTADEQERQAKRAKAQQSPVSS